MGNCTEPHININSHEPQKLNLPHSSQVPAFFTVSLQKIQSVWKGGGEQPYLHLLHGLDADPTAPSPLQQLLLEWVHQDDGAETRRFSPLHVVEERSGFFRFVTNDCGNVSWKESSQTSCFQ